MAENLDALWDQATPVKADTEDLDALWVKAKPIDTKPPEDGSTKRFLLSRAMGAAMPLAPLASDLAGVAPKGFGKALAAKYAQGATKGWVDEAGGLLASLRVGEQSVPRRLLTRALGVAIPLAPLVSDLASVERVRPGVSVPGTETATPFKTTRDAIRRGQSKASDVLGSIPAGIVQAAGDLSSDYLAQKLGLPVGHPAVQAALGALYGAGESPEADVGMLKDAGVAGGASLVASGLGRYAVAPLARKVGPMLKEALKGRAIDQARRFLLSGADQMSNRAKVPAEVVEEALKSRAVPVGGNVDTALERLESLVTDQGAKYGQIIDELDALGVRGPKASELAQRIVAAGDARFPTEMNDAVLAAFPEEAQRVLAKVGNSPRRTLSLPQAEGIKQKLQGKAKYDRLNMTGVDEARQEIASIARQANEDAIDAAAKRAPVGSRTAELAAEFVPTKERFGRLAGAKEAAARGVPRASQRQGGTAAEDAIQGAQLVESALSGGVPGGVSGALLALAKGGRGRLRSAEARALYGLSPLADPALQAVGAASKYLPVGARAAMPSEEQFRALIAYLQGEEPQ